MSLKSKYVEWEVELHNMINSNCKRVKQNGPIWSKSVHLKKFQEIAVTKASTPKPNVEPNVIAQIFIPKGQKPKGD